MNEEQSDALPVPPDWLRLLLVVAVLALVFAAVRAPHAGSRDPLHFDEWSDIGRARALLHDQTLPILEPDTGYPRLDNDIVNRNREFGFFVLLGQLAILGGSDLLAWHPLLAPTLACLTAAALFGLVQTLTGRFWEALLAALFLSTAPSNVNLLGPTYFLPLSLSLPFLLLLVTASVRARESGDLGWGAVGGLSALVLAVFYPPALVVAVVLYALQFLLAPETWSRWRRELAVGLALAAIAVCFVAAEWQGGVAATVDHVASLLVFGQRWHMDQFRELPLSYFASVPLLLLSLVGAACCWTSPRCRWLLGWFVLPLIADWFYRTAGQGVLLPYQRMWHFWLLSVYALAGIGLAWAAAAVAQRVPARFGPGLAGLAAVAAVVAVFSLGGAELRTRQRHASVPAEGRVALDWIAAHYEPPARVHTNADLAMFVKGLTGLDPVDAAVAAVMAGRRVPPFRCSEKVELVVGRIDCDGFRAVYESQDIAVYESEHLAVHEPMQSEQPEADAERGSPDVDGRE